ncbi:hypothetical protein ACFQX4_12745 [Roseomonas sp. GCM10028921]
MTSAKPAPAESLGVMAVVTGVPALMLVSRVGAGGGMAASAAQMVMEHAADIARDISANNISIYVAGS